MVRNGAAGLSRVKLCAIEMRDAILGNRPFWSPEALLLLVTTSGQVQHDGLPVTLRMVRVSLVSVYFVYKAIQNWNLTGPIQRSQPLGKKIGNDLNS